MIAGQKLWRNAAKPVFQRGRCSLLKAEAARFLSHSNANPRPLWIPTTHTTNSCCPKITPCHPCACGHDGKLPVVISFFISSPHHQRTVERESRKLSNFYYKLKNCSEFFSETVKCWEEEKSFPKKFVSIFSVSALLNSAPALRFECRWVPAAQVDSVPNSPLPPPHLYRTHNIRRKRKAQSNISSDLKSLLKRG